MPHVSVKLWSGRSEKQKQKMADKIVEAVKEAVGASEYYISVAIEDVESSDWSQVYENEIMANEKNLYKKPGYNIEDL